jgi:5-methylcytosine-specific restriction endonuclease McrA
VAYDAYKDPYGLRVQAHKKRVVFTHMKQTLTFQAWKKRQFKVQLGKCAWCLIPLTNVGVRIHVDHVTPLFFEGENDFSNLVLSCSRCNLKKWISNRYVVPEWIKARDLELRVQKKLKAARKAQYRQARQLIDEAILREIREHL